jgi:hypothetical protein
MLSRSISSHLIAGAVLLAGEPAFATATLTCDVEEQGHGVHLMATVGHEGLRLDGLRGSIELGPGSAAVDLDAGTLMQSWLDDRDLRLRLHVFSEAPRPDLDLLVVTRRRSDTDYVGRYRLTVEVGTERRVRRGRIVCSVG